MATRFNTRSEVKSFIAMHEHDVWSCRFSSRERDARDETLDNYTIKRFRGSM